MLAWISLSTVASNIVASVSTLPVDMLFDRLVMPLCSFVPRGSYAKEAILVSLSDVYSIPEPTNPEKTRM